MSHENKFSSGSPTSHENMVVFTGNANPALTEEMVRFLGLPIGRAVVDKFSDGETNVEIMENVRGREVFVVQPTCAPSNDNLMELLVMLDALNRASARSLTAVIPYFGYARQDRRPRTARVAISAKLVASMVGVAGADRVLTMDLHADQIQGFFDIACDNIYASPVLLAEVWRKASDNLLVVSPDAGGVVRARALAKQLGVELAIIDKRRPRANEAKVMHIIGEVEDRVCVLVDDVIDTAATLCQAAEALKEHGATRVIACATHPVFSGRAVANIEGSELDEVVVTNTIPLREEARECAKIRQISIAELLAEAVRRICDADSLSSLFME